MFIQVHIIYIYMCISYHVSICASCDALHSEAMRPHNWELTHCTWRLAGNTSLSPHQALFYLGIGPFRVQVWIVLILLWNGNIRVTSKGSLSTGVYRAPMLCYVPKMLLTYLGWLPDLPRKTLRWIFKTPSAELPKIWSCSFFCSSCFL